MRLCASAAQTPWRHGIPAGSPGRMLRIRAACSRRHRPSAAAAAAAVMRANGLWDEDLNCAKDGAAVTFDQYLAAALHARVAYKEVPLERSRARPPLPPPLSRPHAPGLGSRGRASAPQRTLPSPLASTLPPDSNWALSPRRRPRAARNPFEAPARVRAEQKPKVHPAKVSQARRRSMLKDQAAPYPSTPPPPPQNPCSDWPETAAERLTRARRMLPGRARLRIPAAVLPLSACCSLRAPARPGTLQTQQTADTGLRGSGAGGLGEPHGVA